jgi:uncharacterized protein
VNADAAAKTAGMPDAVEELRTAPDLIVLTEGDDELLLANPAAPHPLYIQRGRDYVRNFLDAVPKLRTAARIIEAFPGDAPLLEMLVERKIVIPVATEGNGAPAAAPKPNPRAERSFVSLYLLLTQTCNLQCVYCLDGRETYQTGRRLRMSEEIARTSVEKYLRSLVPKGHLEIVFFGGEPLLNWPLVKKVIRFCESEMRQQVPDRTFNYHLTTNLATLPPDLIDWAKRHRITFLTDVDGPAELHDRTRPFKNGGPSFATIAGHVRRLAEAGLKVSLRATVTAVNQHHMVEIAKLHRELGGAGCAFVPVNPANSDGEILPESLLPDPAVVIDGLEAAYRSGVWASRDLYPFNAFASRVGGGAKVTQGCGAPYGMTPVVQCDGSVYPCIYLVGMPRFLLGNVMDGDFPKAGVCDWMVDALHVDHLAACRGCQWRYMCGGNCPMLRFTVLENGDVTARVAEYTRSIMCDYPRRVFELLLWEKGRDAAAKHGPSASEQAGDLGRIC